MLTHTATPVKLDSSRNWLPNTLVSYGLIIPQVMSYHFSHHSHNLNLILQFPLRVLGGLCPSMKLR